MSLTANNSADATANGFSADTADETVLYCPACGYDLRASPEGRCNECGLVIDRASLRVSAFPWAHRRQMGQVRAYVKTVWQVLLSSRSLDYETAKPQAPKDARSFARVTGTLIAVTALAPLTALALRDSGLKFLAIPPFKPLPRGISGFSFDLIIPWATGVTLWPVALLSVVLMSRHLARAARPMFRRGSATPVHAERAAAIALYTAAPLVLLLPVMAFLLAVAMFDHGFQMNQAAPELTLVAVVAAALFTILALLGTFIRTGQWLARIRHGGVVTGAAGAAGLLGLWVVGAVFYGVVLPWCAGFLYLVVDSLR